LPRNPKFKSTTRVDCLDVDISPNNLKRLASVTVWGRGVHGDALNQATYISFGVKHERLLLVPVITRSRSISHQKDNLDPIWKTKKEPDLSKAHRAGPAVPPAEPRPLPRKESEIRKHRTSGPSPRGLLTPARALQARGPAVSPLDPFIYALDAVPCGAPI
jgi:hypothetical protein